MISFVKTTIKYIYKYKKVNHDWYKNIAILLSQ